MRVVGLSVIAAIICLILVAVILSGCNNPQEPEWKCKKEHLAYYVPNVKGTYTAVYHCDDPDVKNTEREWRVGEDTELATFAES